MFTWQGTGGFSLDASVRIHGSDRAGRERLLRYCARPPFALDRLRIEREPAGRSDDAGVRRVFYRPARPTPGGRTLLALSPLEFLDAISRLIPPPRVHRHRNHGVLAPNARLRPHVVALVQPPAPGGRSSSPGSTTFPLRCPECGSEMRILAFLTDPGPTDDFDQTPDFDPAVPLEPPDFYERVSPDDLRRSAAFLAGLLYQAATADSLPE